MKFKSIALAVSIFLTACAQVKYTATTPKGSESFTMTTLMGSEVLDTAGGTRWTSNKVKNGGQFFQAVTTVAGSVAGAYVKNSNNAAATAAGAQATTQAVAAGKEATAQAAIQAGVTTEAIKAGVTTIPK